MGFGNGHLGASLGFKKGLGSGGGMRINSSNNQIILSEEFFGTSLPAGWSLTNPNSANGLTYSTDDGGVWKSAHTSGTLISAYTDYVSYDGDLSTYNYLVFTWDQTSTGKSGGMAQYELIYGDDNDNKIYIGNSATTGGMFFNIRIAGVTTVINFAFPEKRCKMTVDWVNDIAEGFYWDGSAWVSVGTHDISGFATQLTQLVWSPSDITGRTGGEFGILNSIYVTNYDYSTFIPVTGIDPWVSRFITSTGISDQTTIDALNTRVVSMRHRGTFNKRYSIYPFVGGTAGTCAIALKKTSANLSAFGSITYASTGVQGNGTTGYMSDGVIPSVKWVNNQVGISFYSRTDSAGVITDFGSNQATTQRFQIISRNASDNLLYDCYNSGVGRLTVANTNSSGRISVIRRSGENEGYRNGVSLGANATEGGTIPSIENFFMALNNLATASNFSAREYAWLETFVVPLSDTEEADEYTDELTFQTSLSRNV